MMAKRSVFGVVLGLAVVSGSYAERRPEEKKEATHVFTGELVKLTTTKDAYGKTGEITTYKAELQIDVVEKGKGKSKGDKVTFTWSAVTKEPKELITGASGHVYGVKKGDRVRVYLINRDKTYDVIYSPDGLEKLKK